MKEIINELTIFFSYPFVQRAIIVGIMISICAALLGVSLVLKGYAMIGNGLSNVGFGALAVATSLNLSNISLQFSIPVVIIAAYFLLRINENSKIPSDSAIAVTSTIFLAIGYIMMYKNGTNIDVCNYMFGNIFTITDKDALLSVIIGVVVIVLFFLFYYKIFAVTLDEKFAKAVGIKTNFYNMIIASLTAIVVVLGMRMMGTLLISAIVIFPALISMRVCKSYKSVIIYSAIVSVVCFIIGIIVAHLLDMPTGSTIVLVNGIILLVVKGCGKR